MNNLDVVLNTPVIELNEELLKELSTEELISIARILSLMFANNDIFQELIKNIKNNDNL